MTYIFPADEWTKKTCNGIYIQWGVFNPSNGGIPAISSSIGKPGGRYAEWSKPDKGRKRQCDPSYTQNQKQSQTHENRVDNGVIGLRNVS